MNKETFLTELQARIRVLEDSEQQDILSEYAQHIDLQIHEGASEDEATGDFGNLDALAAEILEAYHVKAAFAAPPQTAEPARRKVTLPDPRPGLKRGWERFIGGFRRMGGAIARFFRAGWRRIAALVRPKSTTPRPKKEKKERFTMEYHQTLHGMGAAVQRGGSGLGRLLRRLLWLLWNLAVVLASLPFAALVLFALLCIGTLTVLLFQGYPLVGITLSFYNTLPWYIKPRYINALTKLKTL